MWHMLSEIAVFLQSAFAGSIAPGAALERTPGLPQPSEPSLLMCWAPLPAGCSALSGAAALHSPHAGGVPLPRGRCPCVSGASALPVSTLQMSLAAHLPGACGLCSLMHVRTCTFGASCFDHGLMNPEQWPGPQHCFGSTTSRLLQPSR